MLGLILGVVANTPPAGGGGGGGGSFVPTDLGAALQRWYDASNSGSITLATGVSQWNDLSGNSRHLSNSTGSDQPFYYTNASVAFDGGATHKLFPTTSWGSQYDIYIVYTAAYSTSNFRVGFHAGEQILIMPSGADTIGAWKAGFAGSGYSLPVSTRGLVRVKMDGSTNVSQNLNGGTMSGTLATYSPISTVVDTIGNDRATSGRGLGRIHEIIVTDNLSLADQQKVEAYLAKKWNLQNLLPGGHPGYGAVPHVFERAIKSQGIALSTTTATDDTAAFSSFQTAQTAPTTLPKSSGKWYVEFKVGASGTVTDTSVGLTKFADQNASYLGGTSNSLSNGASGTGWLNNNTFSGESIPAYTNNDVIQLAVDLDNLKIWCNVNNGTWKGASSGSNPATNTKGYSIPSSGTWWPAVTIYQSGNTTFRVQQTQTYSPPSGFSQWC